MSLLTTFALIAISVAPTSATHAWQQIVAARPAGLHMRLEWSVTEMDAPMRDMKQMAPRLEQAEERQARERGLPDSAVKALLAGLKKAHVNSEKERTSTGELLCETDGTTYRQVRTQKTLQVKGEPATPVKGKTAEGWRPGYETKDFLSPASAAQIERESPNPFGMTGGIAANPIMLGLLPVASRFSAENVTTASPRLIQLCRLLPKDPSNYEELTFDLAKGIPIKYEVVNILSGRPLNRLRVLSTCRQNGTVLPKEVVFEELRNDGSASIETHYILKNAQIGPEAHIEDAGQPAEPGEFIMDSRFGPGQERYYLSDGKFLSDEEVRAKPTRRRSANRKSKIDNLSHCCPSQSASATAFHVALIATTTAASRGPASRYAAF